MQIKLDIYIYITLHIELSENVVTFCNNINNQTVLIGFIVYPEGR